MNFTIEYEQESDGRWLAEVMELPGVMAYGASAADAQNLNFGKSIQVRFDQRHNLIN